MDEDFEYDEGSDIDNFETEQVWQDTIAEMREADFDPRDWDEDDLCV